MVLIMRRGQIAFRHGKPGFGRQTAQGGNDLLPGKCAGRLPDIPSLRYHQLNQRCLDLSVQLRLSATHRVKFVVGTHRHEISHAVAKTKKGRDARDVPDILIGKIMPSQGFEICITY